MLKGYVITGKRGGYTQAEGFDAYVKSYGGKDVYFVTPGEEGGRFLVGFSDDKSLYRWPILERWTTVATSFLPVSAFASFEKASSQVLSSTSPPPRGDKATRPLRHRGDSSAVGLRDVFRRLV